MVGVRAKNAQGQWGGWRNSAAAGPYSPQPTPAPPASVTLTRGYNTVTAAWPAVTGAVGYHVTYSSDGGGSWSLAAFDQAASSVTIASADNSATYVVGVRAKNADGIWGGWRNSSPAGPLATPLLTVGGITATAATLTIWGHSGNWHYRADWGPHSAACSAAVTGSAADLSGLTAATHYTYTAYSDTQCSTALADIEFDTTGTNAYLPTLNVEAGTLGWDSVTLRPSGWAGSYYYKSSKAPHNSNCNGPVASGSSLAVSGLRPATAYTYTMYDYAGCETDVAQVSFTTAALPAVSLSVSTLRSDRITLAPTGWSRAWHYTKQQGSSAAGACTGPVGPGAATISGALLSGAAYTFRVYAYSGCGAADELASAGVTVPELASAPGRTTASLTLRNWSAPWWYLRLGAYDSDGDLVGYGGQCQGPVAAGGTGVAAGLVSDESYGFQAYSSAGACQADRDDTSGLLTAGTLGPVARVTTVDTVSFDASDVTGSGATLAIGDYSGQWYARQTAPAAGPCVGPVTGATLALTSLVEGQAHAYGAYHHASCGDANELATATFTTLSLAASSVAGTGATLTLSGHSGNWYYTAGAGPDAGSCRGPVSTATKAVTGLTAATAYRYTAHSGSTCAAEGELASEAFTTPSLAASGATGAGATLTITGHGGDWYYKAGAGPHSTCTGPVGTASTTLAGLSAATSYTYTAYRNSSCSAALAAASPFTTAVSLTATEITPTSAQLVIDGHTAQWWYKASTGPDSSCQGPVAANDDADALTGLTERSSYAYTAYSQTGCNSADLLATAAAFDTGGLSVGNTSQTANSVRQVGWIGDTTTTYAYATSFTTGSVGGYALDSVYAPFGTSTAGAPDLVVWLYTESSGKPSSERTSLGGAKPGSHSGQMWQCTSANCTLSASTTYWIVMRLASLAGGLGNLSYGWKFTNSDDQTNNPADAGWSIGNSSYSGEQTRAQSAVNQPAVPNWATSISAAGQMKLTVALTPGLDASGIAAGSATLTLSNYEGVWWHQRTSPSDDSTCHRVDGSDAARVSGLSASTSYTYKAYDAPGCAAADEIASETFSSTTAASPSLAASSVTGATATLTVSNHSSAWHYRADAGPDAACTGPVTAGTAAKALSGLTAGTAYTYGVYSDSGCSVLLAAESFRTPALAAGAITNTTATLSLADYSGTWHYRHTTPSGGACSAAVTHTGATVVGLAPGASYTFAAYSDAACSTLLATAAAFTADALVAGGVSATGATLSLSGHTGAWRVRQTAPAAGACSSAIAAGSSHSVSGLAPGTAYTYTAYSDSGCTTAVGVGSFTTLPVTLTASGITASAATLTIDGHTAAWWYRGSQSGAGCTSVTADTAAASVSGLTPGASYTYAAYSDSSCTARLAAAPAFSALAVSVHSVADTSAILRVSYRVGDWYYKAGTGPHSTCTGPVSGADAALVGLSSGSTYAYSAYSDAACTSPNRLGTAASFTTNGLSASAVTAAGATLTLAGHSGAWWFRNDVRYDPKGIRPYSQCYRSDSASTTLGGLSAGHTYTFKAYPEYGCPADKSIAAVTFTTSGS